LPNAADGNGHSMVLNAPMAGFVTITCTPLPGELRTFIRASC